MRPTTAPTPQPAELLPVFQRLLPLEALRAIVESSSHHFYQRIYTPLVLLWGFVHQQTG